MRLLLLILIPCIALAQNARTLGRKPLCSATNSANCVISTNSSGAMGVTRLAADPATCAVGEVYFNTTTAKTRQCYAANTWGDQVRADSAGDISAGTAISTVSVGGVTRAVKYLTASGAVSRIDLFADPAVTDYGDPATVGSVQWAIDALPATGGLVRMAVGTYEIASTVTISKMRVVLEGNGNATLLKQKNGANLARMIYVTAADGYTLIFARIRNFQIEGNKTNNPTAGHGIQVSRAGSGSVKDLQIEHVFIEYCKGSGIQIDQLWGGRISHVISEYNDGDGITVAGLGVEGYYSNIYCAENVGNGLSAAGTDNVFTNIQAWTNGMSGIKASGTNSVWSNLRLKDNSVGSTTYAALWVVSGAQSLSNIRITQTTAAGWGLRVHVSNTRVANVVATGTGATADIEVVATTTDSVLTNITASTFNDAGTRTRWENVAPVTYTAATAALPPFGMAYIDTSARDVAATLANGSFVGQVVTIVLTEATNSADGGTTVTIANHETSSPEVAQFTAAGETLRLMWNGAKWLTLKATCTFP